MIKLNNSYIAGFFDGEGCVMVAKLRKSRGLKKDIYGLTISFCNRDYSILKGIQDYFLNEYGINGGYLQHKPKGYERLEYRARASYQILKILYNDIRIKKWQVLAAICFQEHKNQYGGNRYHPPTQEELRIREDFFRFIRNLKHE